MAATPSLHSKLPLWEPSIFDTMNQVSRKYNALNLAQGYPDFGTDPELVRLLQQAVADGHNQYAPMAGVYTLREAIAAKTESLYGACYDPETEITLTNGATQAIFTAIAASIRPGDEVIIFKPAYDCYEPTVKAHGGIPVLQQLQGEDFHIDWEALEAAIGPKTRMLVLNSPHNPSGTVLKAADLLRLEKLLENTNILVLSDEAYEHLVYDGLEHQSFCRYPGLRERTFICASFGKTFHVTGWKLGYCLAPAALMQEFQKLHEFIVFSVNHPAQRAVCQYLEDPSRYLDLNAFFQRKRDLFLEALQGSRFRWKPSEGTYFQLLDYSAISGEPDRDFAEALAREHGVAAIPISVFNLNREDRHQLRFCFAKADDTLLRAAEILCRL
ncbi:methionine aminotransferase [Robiginitalea sp. M366]|uniref:methionine aminotransferase n=1 Tax=Robiginitalea aestuariiviva TaxID=3036903 RepID=UPI00240E6813|nr:methionine aminotransferase [Robiginitalea aestuariiviva]MDG1571417.1 methionine aminotransferase [Robiginitalea aestuariiviva]